MYYGGFESVFNRDVSSCSYAVLHAAWIARVTSDTSVTLIQEGTAVVVAVSGGGWKCLSGE